jgi:hypothetical protein
VSIQIQVDIILHLLDEALDGCRALGLAHKVAGSRFEMYQRDLLELRDRLLRGGAQAIKELVAGPEEQRVRYVNAILQAGDLAVTVPYMKASDPKRLKPKLQRILGKADVLLADETERSNDARNIQFELAMAARLATADFEAVLGDRPDPDVACRVGEDRIHVECKRPFSPGSIQGNISDAQGALRESLGRDPTARGLVMISIMNTAEPRHHMLWYVEERDVDAALGHRLEAAADATRDVRKQLASPILGVVFVDEAAATEIGTTVITTVHRARWVLADHLSTRETALVRIMEERFHQVLANPTIARPPGWLAYVQFGEVQK